GTMVATHVNLRKSDNSGYEPPHTFALEPSAAFDIEGDGDIDLCRVGPFKNMRFTLPTAGARRQYGNASAGTGGMKPVLGARGPFRANESAQLRLRGARGGT